MSNEFLNYNQVLEKINANNEKKRLLVGNGFSMAYNQERFSFISLLQNAIDKEIIQEDSEIHRAFSANDTSDFEEIIKMLENTSKVLEIYKEDKALCEKLRQDSQKLKNHLIEVVTNNHPEKITDISENLFVSTINFIKEYDSIYSLNYDLLLYWATEKMRERLREGNLYFTDGFGSSYNEENAEYVVFNKSHNNTLFYLHGALHIFDDKDKIIKKTYSRTGRCLKEQIQNELNNDRYPVFVSEGTSNQKKAKIIHNAYLNHCYKSLSAISGSLVVFGTTLKSNDTHIQEAILNSKIKCIYFGVSNLEKGQQELSTFIDEATKKNKQVSFYDYKSVKIWTNNQ